MMMMVMAAGSLGQVLYVGELSGLRGAGKICRKLVELICFCRVSIRLGRLCSALQIRGDLLGNLLVFGWVRLLQLLERTQHLA